MGYSAVSLFSGAGGMDVGFKEADFDIVFANDIDPVACDTYDENHKIKISRGDLLDFNGTLKKFKGTDIIFGGPPCQGFSVAGKMNPNDERSKLIWNFFDIVELLMPQAFVCENVKALAVNNRWKDIKLGLLNKAEKSGYHTILFVLNSAHFDVPQSRERMFLIGFKKNKLNNSFDSIYNAFDKSLKSQHKKPKTLYEIIRKLGPAGSKNNNRLCTAKITYAKNPVLRKSPYAGMLFNGAGRPINPSGTAQTLPASMGGNKTPIVDEKEIFHDYESFIRSYHKHLTKGGSPYIGQAPQRLRRLTIDEAIAIQTFPQKYTLMGGTSSIYRQIGNAVPSNLAKAVANSVKELLDLGYKEFINKYSN